MKLRSEYTCPLEMTHDIIRGKWKPVILWQLGKGHVSLSKLKKEICGISEKMLLEQLKELQEFDMVSKKQYEGYPLKVEYSLTLRGERILESITIMQNVGIELMLEDHKEDLLISKGLMPTKK
jgi:DNA-binding HxlR family transcriptional regulator